MFRIPSGRDTILFVMVLSETTAGTPVIEMTATEYAAYLDTEVRRALGISAEEFRRAYAAGTLDDGDPEVTELVGLLRIGQNGHRTKS